MGKFWLHSPNHWALHFRELATGTALQCVCGNFRSQAANANQSSWLLGPSSSQCGRSEGGLCSARCGTSSPLGAPIGWSLPEPIHYTQTAQKEPNLPGHWEQHSCIGRASCPNTAPFQGGSLGTSTWRNTGYMHISNFRVRVLE